MWEWEGYTVPIVPGVVATDDMSERSLTGWRVLATLYQRNLFPHVGPEGGVVIRI